MDEEAVSQMQDDNSPTVEESTTDEQINNQPEDTVETVEQDEQSNSEDTVEEQPELTPRQQKRVDQIEEQAKEHKFNKILDRIQNARPASRQQPSVNDALNYREAIDAPDEVYDSLEQDRTQYGKQEREQGYSEGLKTAEAIEFRTNLKLDLPLVKEKLDKLDPADAEAIDRTYLQMVGYDPSTGYVQRNDIGYADFVEAQIEMAERLAANLHASSQKNIAKQAANTGVRPDGATRQGIRIESPGDIAKLTPEQFEKNREAIYKQLGLPSK